jgi:hypothetical protein
MNLIGTINVALFGGMGFNIYEIKDIMSDISRGWANYDYQIINQDDFVDIEIYGIGISEDILYDVLDQLDSEGVDAFIY